MSDLASLRDAIRKAATERTWSQGVTLARDQRVIGRSANGRELELEVRISGRTTPFEVTLNLEDGEWECSCPSRDPVCSHVVAAALAAEQADGKPTPTKLGTTLRYVLSAAASGSLKVQRVLVRGERTVLLPGSLMTYIAKNGADAVATLEADLLADRMISARDGAVSGERVDRLLGVLADARDVHWGEEPVTTSPEPVLPRAVIEDSRGGVSVKIDRDPVIHEVVAAGVVRTVDNQLRPIGAVDLGGLRLEKLPQRFEVHRTGFAELIGRTIPALSQRILVEVRTQALPKLGARETPRIAFEVEQDGDRLRVFPTMVYGDPPRARVDGALGSTGRLVHLSGPLPIRDEDAERKLLHRLRAELNLVPGRRVELAGRDAFALQNGLASWLRLDAGAASAATAIALEAKVAISGRSFDVNLVGNDGRSVSIGAALRAWQAGVDLVPLPGGGWGRVPMEWLARHGHRVADLLAMRGDDRAVPIYALPDLARLCEDLDQPPPVELDRIRPLLDDFDGIPAAALSGNFVGELRPYQQRGVDWLSFCRTAGLGAILADDMGLGKTIQALAVLPKGKQTLVVSPTSVLFNWLAELQKFRPDLLVGTYHGSRRVLDPTVDVVLTSYPILRNDSEALADEAWEIVILDESQMIKNPDSQVARAAYRLKAKWKLTLSGTPIENRLEELWSQVHFTNPGLLGGRADFAERWAEPIGDGDADTAARLRERIRPFVLRRLKAEVAPELPPRTESIMYVELDEEERATYDAIRAATQKDIVAMLEAGGGVMAALEALLRLRQAACHTALLPSGPRDGEAPVASSKVERLMTALEDAVADDHRALVFSQWTSLLDLIEPHLEAAGIGFVRLDGATPSEKRAEAVASFQRADGPPVMLLSLKAGGTGLNLTAADHVFLVDPWWNPAVEDQAADRAHRIGQDKPVMVYRMVARDTVEDRILALQERKRALAAAALSDAGGATGLTREDLLALLS